MRVLITETWLLASFVFISFGAVSSSVVLVSIGVLVLGTGGSARLWARLSLEEVGYRRTLSERRVFVGESVDVTLEIANRKVIPVPWVEVRETLPRAMPASDARTQPGSSPGTHVLLRSTSLGARDRLEWPLSLRAVQRGYFRVGPARLRSGDLFGFFEREETPPIPTDGIVVYPRTYALPELGLDSARPFGERRGGLRIFEDPSRVIGVRDYIPGDALKRIDWNATARVGRLQSRLYEPSRTQAVIVALNIPTFERSWQGSDPVLLERAICVGASIARAAFEQGHALGMLANGSFPDADRPIRIGAGSRPDQLNRVLEALAMVTNFTTSDLSAELEDHRHALPAGATIVVIAAMMPEDLAATLERLRSEGHFVHVVKTSRSEWPVRFDRIPVSEIAPYMEEREAEAANDGLGPVDGIEPGGRGLGAVP